ATGFPIALVSAMLACGLTLDDIPCGKYGTLKNYYPDGEYVVIKFARWAFEKFKGAEDKLGTQMRAVGEVMSIGKSYKEAFQKSIRSLETGRYGLGYAKNFATLSKEELIEKLHVPTSERQFIMYEALRKGATVDELYELTKIKRYFIEQMKELVIEEEELKKLTDLPSKEVLEKAKLDGFSDKYLADVLKTDQKVIRELRAKYGIKHHFYGVHVSGTENSSYYYSSYHTSTVDKEVTSFEGDNKILILGGGPNRIGQGIEFDYCSCHAAMALKRLGFKTIIINCNPETVSTDYDTSDVLFFEPLTLEEVLSIHELLKPLGVIAQFGGQTPLNIASSLKKYGVRILGTPPEVIDMAEDRDLFRNMMEKLHIPMPESGMAVTVEEALEIAERIGYPVMVRPSYVLGGRGMEVVSGPAMLEDYMKQAKGVTPDRPILIDRFLKHATECESDAICDGENAFVPAVMEHIELAGIHSGDSACILPSYNLSEKQIKTIKEYTKKIAVEMKVQGLMNMQYAIEGDTVYVLEANPRASRTVPLVSKVCDINMVALATEIVTSELTGKASPVPSLKDREYPYYGVKEAVFPFNMFPEVDPVLGPEMRSTGETLGMAETFGEAFYKAEEGSGASLPMEGTVLFSVNKEGKLELPPLAKQFYDLGFKLMATGKTCDLINDCGIPCEKIYKMQEGRPNIVDAIMNDQISLIINTPAGPNKVFDDSYIRKNAIKKRIPYMTTMAAAKASAQGIAAVKKKKEIQVKSLQELHESIK
ncbi:MAG: carbamoyl-phosphate synthase large subunit, partial [Lachnospiraceae bacterium]|nr:carbamoyl-phosphate synthase large subunit [Lachnospiraceae bacterium]